MRQHAVAQSGETLAAVTEEEEVRQHSNKAVRSSSSPKEEGGGGGGGGGFLTRLAGLKNLQSSPVTDAPRC